MSSRHEHQRLLDIIDNVDRIDTYLGTMIFDDFVDDPKSVDAVERCLQRLTEVAIKIGDARMSVIVPDLPMAAVRGLGNALRHEYDLIDLRTIWNTAIKSLPSLRAACQDVLANASSP